jgi:hypothetical protein
MLLRNPNLRKNLNLKKSEIFDRASRTFVIFPKKRLFVAVPKRLGYLIYSFIVFFALVIYSQILSRVGELRFEVIGSAGVYFIAFVGLFITQPMDIFLKAGISSDSADEKEGNVAPDSAKGDFSAKPLGESLKNSVVNLSNIFLVIPTLILVPGTLLLLHYFPNLSLLLRIGALAAAGSIVYVFSLVNNIFMVVYRMKKSVPLYRVAMAWSLILVIVIAIPFFAGIFKTSTGPFVQNFVVACVASLLHLYLLWGLSLDTSLGKFSVAQNNFSTLLTFFTVFIAGLSVSFFSGEAFLRALFVSAVLMAALGYAQGHYKNEITKKMLFEYGLICAIFFVLTIIFQP